MINGRKRLGNILYLQEGCIHLLLQLSLECLYTNKTKDEGSSYASRNDAVIGVSMCIHMCILYYTVLDVAVLVSLLLEKTII